MDDLPTGEATAQPCWRCSLAVDPAALDCPHCGAPLWSKLAIAPLEPTQFSKRTESVTTVLVVYGILLLTSVIFGAIANHSHSFFEVDREFDPVAAWWQLVVFDGIDTVIVLYCWYLVRSLPALPRPSRGKRMTAWVLAAPVLALALGLNIGYHALLRDFLQLPFEKVDLVDVSPHFWAWWILMVCVQPALVEELFFRSLAFRALLPYLSGGGTVIVTAVAFGLAHIHSPLSVPILTLLGVVFGLAVLMTGRLWLSMLLHFCHNLAVIWLG